MRYMYIAAVIILVSCRSAKPGHQDYGFDAYSYNINKDLLSRNGAVVSAHPLASKVGAAILKKGGNAFDAAIATQLALAVVYPNAGNIGGGGFMVARLKDSSTVALDYREMAPASATRNMYLDAGGNPLPKRSTRGASSSGVPGTVAGLFETHKYARLPFEELIDPAIALAEKGFAITAMEASALNSLKEEFLKYNSKKPVFIKESPWKAGDTLVQRDLANTLKRIRKHGSRGFYDGKTAKLIVAEMKRGEGYITRTDLRNYRAKWRNCHSFDYKDYRIISMPPPSSGGILLHQMMKMVEKMGLDTMMPVSPQSVQLMTEVERRAYADRAEYMGDPDFYNVPVEKITDSLYLEARMSNYSPGKAGSSSQIRPGSVARRESEETTHISIIDREGNALAVTTTLNDSYGSHTVVGGAGFLLNDEMDDFSIKPGVPNMYGAVGGEANAIAPGKRMLSSMTPTIVLHKEKPLLVVGTPGGTTIPTSVFQTLVDILDFKLTPRQAIDLPKFHHQWLPDRIDVEQTFPSSTAEALRTMGYEINNRRRIGRTEVILVKPDGSFESAADKRGEDSAEGF